MPPLLLCTPPLFSNKQHSSQHQPRPPPLSTPPSPPLTPPPPPQAHLELGRTFCQGSLTWIQKARICAASAPLFPCCIGVCEALQEQLAAGPAGGGAAAGQLPGLCDPLPVVAGANRAEQGLGWAQAPTQQQLMGA